MPNLLHIDSSINGDNSHSRKVTATFAETWRQAHPGGGYVYRDLAASPIPHIDADTHYSHIVAAADHTPAQAAAYQARQPLVEEIASADTILLGVPMYNFGMPSSLKAWFDHIATPRFVPDAQTGRGELSGKRAVVATARGGSYTPGAPREHFDHQTLHIEHLFGYIGVEDVTFIHTEMALSLVVPELAQFKDIYEQTSTEAQDRARELGKLD